MKKYNIFEIGKERYVKKFFLDNLNKNLSSDTFEVSKFDLKAFRIHGVHAVTNTKREDGSLVENIDNANIINDFTVTPYEYFRK